MTVSSGPPRADEPAGRPRRRLATGLVAGALAAAGLGTGLALSLSGTEAPPASASPTAAPYHYYRSVIGRYVTDAPSGSDAGSYGPMGGGMMGGGGTSSSSFGWMTGRSGYAWMMGGAGAPAWMRGKELPGFMMGGDHDPGSVMGELFADAPGRRVSPTEATRLGNAAPAGATRDRAAKRLTFASRSVQLAVLASPSMPAENFKIAGMTNPTVVVPEGAKVSIELVNADSDMAHGLVVTASGAGSSFMPMMTAPPAFPGAALWFLGASTSAGMHAGTLRFTASRPGTYQYLCPVPGHAAEGMVGSFVVTSTR